jgi:uncharacterized protein (TIGR02145 family)
MNRKITLASLIALFVSSVLIIISCNKPAPPSVSTYAISEISYTTASSGGIVTNDGGADITARGVCWNTSGYPVISDSKTVEEGGTGSFKSSLTQLTPGTKYYVRAYATNSEGTGYGIQVPFTSLQIGVATLTTADVTEITQTTAVSGGNVKSENGSPVTMRGICWATAENPTIDDILTTNGPGSGSFVSNLANLAAGTTYYVRAYATNSAGTTYGNQVSFTTPPLESITLTASVTSFTATSANIGVNVTVAVEETVTSRGVYWSLTSDPVNTGSSISEGAGLGHFFSPLTGLTPGTKYYAVAYASTDAGTAYGDEISFTTMTEGSVTDIDGNNYKIVTIGTQVWMAENLKTTSFNDSSPVPLITDSIEWTNTTGPGYCWYNNDETTYKPVYGALYNWYAAATGKLCPTEWHVPTETEFNDLSDFLGGSSVSGGKLKEAGLIHWDSPNKGANNESAFIGVPGGGRYKLFGNFDEFFDIGYASYYYCLPEFSASEYWYTGLYSPERFIYFDHYAPKSDGLSVRCIKN